MPHRAVVLPTFQALISVLVAASLQGCDAPRPGSGRQILDELARARVPMPEGSVEPRETWPALPVSGPITLADLLTSAEARNPDLATARSEVGIAAGRAWQTSLFPNPRVDLSTEDVAWRKGTSEAKTTVGFTQPIIIGGRRQAAMTSARAEQAARLAAVEGKRRVLFGEIAVAYARIIAVREQERLYGELHDLVAKTLSSAQTRFEAKAAPEVDVIRPRVELYRVEAAMARLRNERLSAMKELNLLVGDVTIDSERMEGALSLNPEELDAERLESSVKEFHPLLAVADRRIESASAKVSQVHAEATPDLDVRVGAGHNGALDSGVIDVGLGMTVPLWDRRQGDALSARFELMHARQDRAGIENDLLRQLAAALGEHEASRSQLDIFRDKIVPDARRSFEQTSEGYRAGRASFLDVLDAQRTFTEARVTLAELASATAAARAKVVQVVGPELLDSPSASSLRIDPVLGSSNPIRP